MTRAVEIVGGGLAGLALGVGLRRLQIPVTVLESGTYPRHRTCGEFIHGLERADLGRLGLDGLFADAPERARISWHHRGAPPRRWRLPRPALVVSRHALDARLAETFRATGGELVEACFRPVHDSAPGLVHAHGRRPDRRSSWLGLKMHVEQLELDGDLELHVGRRAYVGLCDLGGGRVNVCGLFAHRPGVRSRRDTGLHAHLAAAGLSRLAARLERAQPRPETFCAVAGLRFGRQPAPAGTPAIGDAYAVVPPFTGQGMAMALAGAALAVEPLRAWAQGELTWTAAVAEISRRQTRRLAGSLRRAAWLHPFLLSSLATGVAAGAQRWRLLPMRRLAMMFHA